MTDHWVREVQCRDVARRERGLRVVVDGGEVVVVAPPGELARLQPNELRQLQQVLATASIEAAHRGAAAVGD